MAEPIRPVRAPPENGEGAAIAITQTAEFKAAVAEAVRLATAEATAAIVAQIAAAKDEQSAGGGDPQDLFRGLALAIAEMSHQGDKRDRPVDPKILAERRAAQERLDAMIVEALALPDDDPAVPRYKTRSKQVLLDNVIEPYTRDPASKKAVPKFFRWCYEPNDAMIPVNEFAERMFVEFRKSRGNKAEYAKNEVKRGIWMTDRGLIIEGSPPVRREIVTEDQARGSRGLSVEADPYDPNASHVRVLGTSHPPARQYNAENPT